MAIRRSGTRRATESQITNKCKPKTLTFKEVLNIDDLKKCFKLRYQQYNNPEYRLFLNENIHQMDIDPFDAYNRHWAVFSDENEILGYARIVQQSENQILADPIQQVIDTLKIDVSSTKKVDHDLPIRKYQLQQTKSSMNQFFKKYQESTVVELSRFMIPEGSPRRISMLMVNAGLGIYQHIFEVDAVILACNDTHEKFWSLYGFRNMHKGETYSIGTLRSVNLYSTFEDIHPTLSQQLRKYAAQYLLTKEVSIEL